MSCAYSVHDKGRKNYSVKYTFKKAVRAGKEAAWRHGHEFSITQRCTLPRGRSKQTKMAVCYPITGTGRTECLYIRKGKRQRVL